MTLLREDTFEHLYDSAVTLEWPKRSLAELSTVTACNLQQLYAALDIPWVQKHMDGDASSSICLCTRKVSDYRIKRRYRNPNTLDLMIPEVLREIQIFHGISKANVSRSFNHR